MAEALLIKIADVALAYECLNDRFYEALQAADDTMPKITRDYLTKLYEEITEKVAELRRPPSEDELRVRHPDLSDGYDE